jgi:hypothetical protein
MAQTPAHPGQPPAQQPIAQPCRSPVFILTASRSGSTLLRFMLDSHPDFACPPETSVASMCAQLARTWDILENADADGARLAHDEAVLTPEATAAIRDSIDRCYGRYLRHRGKQRWCDKSLDTIQHAELILQIYPDAKFICLYRHCMDVIASGIEACPWGVYRYGFDPFVAQNPGNSVAAIGSYWLATVQAMLGFEDNHPGSCHRVRYEDLVTAPEDAATAIFRFLGAEPVPGISTRCFQTPHDPNGPGDEKIWFTGEVTTGSLGRGVQVPAGALPLPTRQSINEALAKLCYRLVDGQWSAAAGYADPRTDTNTIPAAVNGHTAGDRLATAVRAITARIDSRAVSDLQQINTRWPALAGQTVAIVVQDPGGGRQEITWTFGNGTNETAATRLDKAPALADVAQNVDASGPTATFIAGPATWHSLLNGKANIVTEMLSSRLRCVNRRDGHRIRSDEMHAVAMLLDLTRIPLTRTPATPHAEI